MGSGDRVMAEYFYQHADHCFRMMMEEGYRPNQGTNPAQPGEAVSAEAPPADGVMSSNTNVLPAFITANYEGAAAAKPVDPATIQNWEERDA
jgi:hypothetical protein